MSRKRVSTGGPARADDAKLHPVRGREALQRRQDLALGEVAGGAEDDQVNAWGHC